MTHPPERPDASRPAQFPSQGLPGAPLPPPADGEHGGDGPTGWLFRPSSLGASFRIYLPTVVLMRTLGLLRVLLFAYLILKAEYGLQRLALQLINVLAAVARLGMPAGLERYVPFYEKAGQLARFLRRGLCLATGAAVCLTLALTVMAPVLSRLAFEGGRVQPPAEGQPLETRYLVWVTLACLGVTLVLAVYGNLQGVLRGLRMYRALAMMEIAHGLAFLAFAVAGLLLAGTVSWSVDGVVRTRGSAVVLISAYGLSLLVAAVIIAIGLARCMRRWRQQQQPLGDPVRRTASQLFKFSTFVTGTNVLWMLFAMFGLWYLNKVHGEAEAGLFALPRDLMQAVHLLAMTIWPVARNSANRLWEQGARDKAERQVALVFRASGWLLWLLCAGLVLARALIVRLMPQEYATAGPLLPWLLLYFMVIVHLSLPTAHAYLLEKSRMPFIAAAAGLMAYVLSAWWLVPSGRALGASQSAAISAVAALAVLLALVSIVRGTGWIGRREWVLLLAPVLLVLPSVWPGVGGQYLLAGAVAVACLLLAFSGLLWSGPDRRAVVAYLSGSLALITRRRRAVS